MDLGQADFGHGGLWMEDEGEDEQQGQEGERLEEEHERGRRGREMHPPLSSARDEEMDQARDLLRQMRPQDLGRMMDERWLDA